MDTGRVIPIRAADQNGSMQPPTKMFLTIGRRRFQIDAVGIAYTGTTYQYTGVFQDNGAGVLYAFFDIETWPASPFTCKVGVLIQDSAPIGNNQVYSQVFLHDDQGNQFTHYMTSGSSSETPESNSKCTLFAVGSFVTHVGNQYSVTVSLRFNDPYDGGKAISLLAIDNNYGGTSWIAPSSVYVAGTNYGPQTYSVSPASGSSTSGAIQQFQVTVKDPNGIYTVPHMEFMLGMAPSWVFGWQIQPNQRCKVGSEISANLMWLEDAVNQNEYVAPGYVNPGGGSPTLQNSLCTFYPSMSSVTYPAIDTAVITFAVSFQPVFGGSLQDHIFVLDNTGLQHWDGDSAYDGRWTWNNAAPPLQPLNLSVRPSARNNVPMAACAGTGTDSPYIYNYDPPTLYSVTECSGNLDLRYFDKCLVSGNGIMSQIQNKQPTSFDVLLTPSPNAALGMQTLTCISYYYWGYVNFALNVLDDSPATVLSNGSLDGAVQTSQDNGDGTYTFQLSPLAYDYLADNGFLPAAAAGGLIFVPGAGEVVIAVGGAVVTVSAVVALYHWWQIHKNDAPPNLPRPKNAPTGTVPITQYPGITTEQLHEVKKNLNLMPADWTGIAPNGDVITGDINGNAENHGPWQDLAH